MAEIAAAAAVTTRKNYFDELAALLRDADGPLDQKVIAELRDRYDIEQITSLADGR
jgi:hypothetical protein